MTPDQDFPSQPPLQVGGARAKFSPVEVDWKYWKISREPLHAHFHLWLEPGMAAPIAETSRRLTGMEVKWLRGPQFLND